MRPIFALLLPLATAIACAPAEKPAADTASMTVGATALTEADIAGTWTGTMKMAGSDSVAAHWTQVCAAGACSGTQQEAPDTVKSTYRIEGDSAIGVTGAFADATTGGAKMIDNWVVRIAGGQVTGHGWFVLADKPDSVAMRYTFQGSRK